ncbi:hypothetical protein O181_011118 [Austropuccinia psidii MF-1]|uniref:Uncharacterized protein n=1 Tax=Austropuccinia psidii MF-1 TaxID=1389203 RepID=A0A9Q3BUN4_9BASI|nr:hypothetical protein [Austropuccinia psidii MF-1]
MMSTWIDPWVMMKNKYIGSQSTFQGLRSCQIYFGIFTMDVISALVQFAAQLAAGPTVAEDHSVSLIAAHDRPQSRLPAKAVTKDYVPTLT